MMRTRGAVRGFTLMEMLIALVLMSLLMLILAGAMRSVGQVSDRIDQHIDATDDYRLTMQLLSALLDSVSARNYPLAQPASGGPNQAPFFQATPESLSWVGVMPARFGLGGRHYLRLAVERTEHGPQLVLRYAPWTGAATFNDWGRAAAQVLAAPVQSLTLAYQDPASGIWSPVWPPPGIRARDLPPTLLPAAVLLQVHGPAPAWPPLAVAVTATRASDPSAAGASFGGGGN